MERRRKGSRADRGRYPAEHADGERGGQADPYGSSPARPRDGRVGPPEPDETGVGGRPAAESAEGRPLDILAGARGPEGGQRGFLAREFDLGRRGFHGQRAEGSGEPLGLGTGGRVDGFQGLAAQQQFGGLTVQPSAGGPRGVPRKSRALVGHHMSFCVRARMRHSGGRHRAVARVSLGRQGVEGRGRFRVAAEQFRQPFQPAVRGRADGAGTLAEGLRGGLGVEAHDHPQHDGLGLVLRELGDEGEGAAGGHGLDGLAGGVGLGGAAGEFGLVAAYRGATAAHPYVVQGAVAGDAGGPSPEPVRVPAEPVEVTGDLQPGLGRDVLGVGIADQRPYVSEQPWVHRAVHSPERGLVPVLCRKHRGGQLRVVPQHVVPRMVLVASALRRERHVTT